MELVNATQIIKTQHKRDIIIKDYFAKGELMMLFAPTGAGKTFNALSMALSLSCGGSIYGDAVVGNYRTLYLDGEMGTGAIARRLDGLMTSRGITRADDLWTMSPDLFHNNTFPNISKEEIQNYFDSYIDSYGIQILILDNYNTLTNDQDIGDNEFLTWARLEGWLKRLKNKGVSVIMVHHTNKLGQMPSGTVRKDNLMDCILNIMPSPIANKDETLLEVDFKKSRWTGEVPRKLLELVKTDRGMHLELMDYETTLVERVRDMFEAKGLEYVTGRLKIPSWKIKDICNFQPKSKGSSVNDLESFF